MSLYEEEEEEKEKEEEEKKISSRAEFYARQKQSRTVDFKPLMDAMFMSTLSDTLLSLTGFVECLEIVLPTQSAF